MLAAQTNSAVVLLSALAITGCSEACGCENNERAVRTWAECATTYVQKTGEFPFASAYVGKALRNEARSTREQAQWMRTSAKIESACGTFSAAASQARADEAAGKLEDNVVIARSDIDALAIHGMIDEPKLTATKTAEAH